MKQRIRYGLIGLVMVFLLPSVAGAAEGLSFPLGGGVVLRGGIGTETNGRMATGALEYRAGRRAVRVEAAWLRLPTSSFSVSDRPVYPAIYSTGDNAYSTGDDEDIRMVGGSFSFLWFDNQPGIFTSYVLLGAGAYKMDADYDSEMALFIGPGFGGRVAWGRIGIGMELNIQLGFSAPVSGLTVPVKLYATF